MTEAEFIAAYCERSGVAWSILSDRLVALPCACGYRSCEGWAMVPRDPEAIETHTRLYAPEEPDDTARIQAVIDAFSERQLAAVRQAAESVLLEFCSQPSEGLTQLEAELLANTVANRLG